MTRYKFSVEFDTDSNPGKWFWPDLVELDDLTDNTVADWSTWNVVRVDG